MRLIGLTGGIGSGKSTVSTYLKSKGIRIVDADLIAKDVNKRSDTIALLREAFGEQVIDSNGNIDTKEVSKLIFGNTENAQILHQIVLPKIIEEMDTQVKIYENTNETVILDIPLLFETAMDKYYKLKEIWLVSVNTEVQLERVMKRNGYTVEEAMSRINSQMKLEEKAKRATDIIDNSEDLKSLYEQIDRLIG